MKNFLITAALIIVSTKAMAFDSVNSYDARKSSCRSLQTAIANEGRAVIYTGDETYFLAVAGVEECFPGESIRVSTVKTRDVEKCDIGFTCK